jgi:uncharacterized membrane protein YdcZ (DUF606 family)
MDLDEKDIISNDVPKYTIIAGVVVSTMVFSEILTARIRQSNMVKKNLNYGLLISGFLVVTMGLIGSQYFKYKQKNGKS